VHPVVEALAASRAASRPPRQRAVRPAVVRFRRLQAVRRATVLGCHVLEPMPIRPQRCLSPQPLCYVDLSLSGSVCTPASAPVTPALGNYLSTGCDLSTPDFGQNGYEATWSWDDMVKPKVLDGGRKGRDEHEAMLDSILQLAESEGRAKREALEYSMADLKAQCEASLARESHLRDTLQKVREHLECGICMQALCWPVSLRCGHNFCSACVARWESTSNRSGKPLTCPTCRATVGLPVPARSLDHICRVVEEEDSTSRRAEELDAHSKYETACRAVIANAVIPPVSRADRRYTRAGRSREASLQALSEALDIDATSVVDLSSSQRFVEADAPVLPDLRAPTLSAIPIGRSPPPRSPPSRSPTPPRATPSLPQATPVGSTAFAEDSAGVHMRTGTFIARMEAPERIW